MGKNFLSSKEEEPKKAKLKGGGVSKDAKKSTIKSISVSIANIFKPCKRSSQNMIVDSDSLFLFNGLSKNVGKENMFSSLKTSSFPSSASCQTETEHIYNKLDMRQTALTEQPPPVPVRLPFRMPAMIEEDAQSCQSNRRSQQPSMGVKAYAIKNKMSADYCNTYPSRGSGVATHDSPPFSPKSNDHHTYEVLSEAVSKRVRGNNQRFEEESSPSSSTSSSCSSSPEMTKNNHTASTSQMPFLDSVVTAESLPMLSSTSISPSQMLNLHEDSSSSSSVPTQISPIKARDSYQYKSKLTSTLKSKKLRSLSNINFQKLVTQ